MDHLASNQACTNYPLSPWSYERDSVSQQPIDVSNCLFKGIDAGTVLCRFSCTEYGKVRLARCCREPPRRTTSGDLEKIASIIFLVSWDRGDPEIVLDVLFHAFHSGELEKRDGPTGVP